MSTKMRSKNKEAKPFLKWAGGKSQLINEIQKRLPKKIYIGEINNYIEPFVGGGAVFFYLSQNLETIHSYNIFDVNEDLMNTYKIIKYDVDLLINELLILEDEFLELNQEKRKKFFLKIRLKFNDEKKVNFNYITAAKLIFLNRTCFNGLYRVNRKGHFNVPFGKYKNPKICDKENLLRVSKVLQNTEIIKGDFSHSREYIDSNTFVYFDPPYRPISKTASFTSYSKGDFLEEEQIRLAQFCNEIDKIGAKFLLSNSDPKNENPDDFFFEKHYKKFNIDRVLASRSINCKGAKRGKINELIVTNY